MSETTPLLTLTESLQSTDIYDRFPKAQKRVILAVISLAGLIAPFASGCFVPCVPEVARDLNTTGTVINYTVGLYLFTIGVGNMAWAPYAGFYGRQPVYLCSLPLLCLGSLGASLSTDVSQLVFSRTIQAFGASCVTSVGAATISDIYRLEERGTAIGVFLGAVLLGPALAPPIGGIAATYASWRMMQLILFGMGFAAFTAIVMLLPETSHPGSRGVDKMLAQEADSSLGPHEKKRSWRWVWLNPLQPLRLLRGPTILLVVIIAALAGGLIATSCFVLLIPITYTVGIRYGITSPALIGACFIPAGLGNILGAPLSGRLSDLAIIKGRKMRGGKWLAEDRLTATLPGALLLVPISVLVFGLATQFIPGRLGLVIVLFSLFINGLGVDVVLAPSATYNVDVLNTRSAEVMAANSAVRNLLTGIVSAGALPMIRTIGLGTTTALTAVLGLVGFAILWLTIRYGEQLRRWKDIGYTCTAGAS